MNIADLARVRDEDLAGEPVGQASGAGARALMESIMSSEREPVRRRSPVRRGIGFGVVAAGLAAALVVWTPFGGPATEYANAAVSLKAGEDSIEVVINDPEAEAGKFTEAFRAVGLDAEVKKVPVAPEDVGRLIGPATPGNFPEGTGVTKTFQVEGCSSAWCGTVSMPVDYTGKLIFGVGRPAEPGERYAHSARFSPEPGSLSDRYNPYGTPVAEVRTEMERAGMRIAYVVMWSNPDGSGDGYAVAAEHVKDDWMVDSVRKTASDAVTVGVTAPADLPRNSLPRAETGVRAWWLD
ncbi:hypothetical protein AB0I81_18400 [Nonomuraea sp. NPDC050404]|uniref:hypothetical protein n=1 Tax=Nonomuraea sp. NPDC050404 TaxID=3155783 RepID=UPI0033F852DB